MSDEPDLIGKHLAEVMADARKRPVTSSAPLRTPDREQGRLEAHRQLVVDQWSSCVPPRLARAHLDDLTGVVGGDSIRGWAEAGEPPPWRDGVNLILLGATGVGKSYAAVAAARTVVEQSLPCIYWSSPDLYAALDWRTDDHRAVMVRAQRCAVLVLDDLGAEDPNDWTRRKLYELVNARWNANLSTIVTTNLEPTDLEEAVGPRTYSRLAGGAIAVRLVGPDRRRTHAT